MLFHFMRGRENIMSLRFLLSAALLFTCFSASVSRAEQEEGYTAKKRVHHYHNRYRGPAATRFFGRPDISDVFTPYIYYNCPNGCPSNNAPYNNYQTFWERVQTQPDYPVR